MAGALWFAVVLQVSGCGEVWGEPVVAAPRAAQGGAGGANNQGAGGRGGGSGCPDAVIGFASLANGTIGGKGGPRVLASTPAELRDYAARAEALEIYVASTLELTEVVPVASNKSLIGVGSRGVLSGAGLLLDKSVNVIIRNLTIARAAEDAIELRTASRVWIDHCELYSDIDDPDDQFDGLIDVNRASDFITVSWTYLHDHDDVSLVGHSEENAEQDRGHLTVSFHHNWFQRTVSANPRVRFGRVHLFNNLFQQIDDHAVISESEARVLVEANVFEAVATPATSNHVDPVDGSLTFTRNSVAADCGKNGPLTPVTDWTPEYAYSSDDPGAVRALVTKCAGVGNIFDPGAPAK